MANLKLLGAVSGYTELKASDNAIPTTFSLPPTDGIAGQVLSTNGSGQLQFITASGGSGDYTLPTATTVILGGVRVDGTSVTINGSGVISAATYTLPTATATVLGGIKIGSGLTITNGVVSVAAGGVATQADTLKVGSQYRSAAVDEPADGTANTIACRDLDGNLNAVLFQGTATSAQFADLAEKYLADAVYEPGTVMEFGGAKEITIATTGTARVAGVISSNPGFIMNNDLAAIVSEGERTAVLALTGRVPCKVKGSVRKGDLMISAGDGFAMASATPAIGTVIGKSLEDFDSEDGEGIIEIVVGRV
jgi:hypothetical protein